MIRKLIGKYRAKKKIRYLLSLYLEDNNYYYNSRLLRKIHFLEYGYHLGTAKYDYSHTEYLEYYYYKASRLLKIRKLYNK
jgi:hypothetical protein